MFFILTDAQHDQSSGHPLRTILLEFVSNILVRKCIFAVSYEYINFCFLIAQQNNILIWKTDTFFSSRIIHGQQQTALRIIQSSKTNRILHQHLQLLLFQLHNNYIISWMWEKPKIQKSWGVGRCGVSGEGGERVESQLYEQKNLKLR